MVKSVQKQKGRRPYWGVRLLQGSVWHHTLRAPETPGQTRGYSSVQTNPNYPWSGRTRYAPETPSSPVPANHSGDGGVGGVSPYHPRKGRVPERRPQLPWNCTNPGNGTTQLPPVSRLCGSGEYFVSTINRGVTSVVKKEWSL